MKNQFLFSNDNKRYHTYNYYLQHKFGGKTAKIPVNLGLPCPHSGCTFCNFKSSSNFSRIPSIPEIKAQFHENRHILSKKWDIKNSIAYFQYGTNTNASVEVLREIFEGVLSFQGVCGIDIATRPDCLDSEKIQLLVQLSRKTSLTVELGLQTSNDSTAKRINRGYSTAFFSEVYKELAENNIPVCVHVINSLPDETKEHMLDTARFLASLKPLPYGVKFHMLNIVKNTPLADEYMENNLHLLSKEQYIDVLISQLEILPPEIAVLRVTGDPEAEELIAPQWLLKKFTVINDIDKEMVKRGTYQGAKSGKIYLKGSQTMNSNIQSDSENNFRDRVVMTNILSTAKKLLDLSIKEKGLYIDFTMGNGFDTVYLSKACPSGKIYAFDIQPQALENTAERLKSENCIENYTLILDSHSNFESHIPELSEGEKISGGVFNLGYRPGGDKSKTTLTDSTLEAVRKIIPYLDISAILVIVVYPGHEEGTKEGDALLLFLSSLPQKNFDVLFHRLVNIPDSPYIIAVQRKQF